MDGNKDEALRCVGIAKEAIASGNKKRALKFIEIAKRLNQNLSVDDLLAACETLDSASSSRSNDEHLTANGKKNEPAKVNGVSSGERTYTEEHVQLIRQIKRNKDYYAILGVEKSCSVEEIKKAYKKLSLKVHPDKNKAPGSEEAFKKVCMAFKCLSDNNSRREYDQVGLVDGFEYNQQPNVRRRRRTGHDLFEEDFDPNEIFRSFFGQAHVYRDYPMYRTRETGTQQRADVGGTGPNLMVLLQILPFLLIFLLAYLPFSEPEYALQRNYTYQFRRMTEKHEVEYFVKSPDFDQKFPVGSPGRADIETSVIRDYKNMLGRYCHVELQRRQWSRNFPTPHCDKLQNFGLAH